METPAKVLTETATVGSYEFEFRTVFTVGDRLAYHKLPSVKNGIAREIETSQWMEFILRRFTSRWRTVGSAEWIEFSWHEFMNLPDEEGTPFNLALAIWKIVRGEDAKKKSERPS